MPASTKYFDKLRAQLKKAKTRADQDKLLDEWIDAVKRATDWDADQWGFNTDAWCLEERAQMEKRSLAKNKRTEKR